MKTEYQNFIILRLKKIRAERGFSQKDVATMLGISPGQLGNIESPKAANKYTLSHILTLCNKFKIPIEQIFIEDEDYLKREDIIKLLISNIVKYEER